MMAVRIAHRVVLSGAVVLIALVPGSVSVTANPAQSAGSGAAANARAANSTAVRASGAGTPSVAAPSEPPWLGVGIRDGMRGVEITEVIDDTPAYEAGLMAGDEILVVAGARVGSVQSLKMTLSGHQVSETVVVEVWREGRIESLPVLLAGKLSDSEILYRRLVGRPAPDLALPGVDPVSRLASRPVVSSKFGSRVTVSRGSRGSGISGAPLGGSISGLPGDDIEGLRGDVLVVYFFETDCRDCSDLHRPLSRLADARRRDGLRIVAVSRQPDAALLRWARRLSPSFTVVRDGYGELARSYRVEKVPALIVIDRRAEVVYAGMGGEDNLEHAAFAIERALVSERHGWAR